jgi:hypothetical protein
VIHGLDIDTSFEQTPGTLGECANAGLNLRLTGNVTVSSTPGAAGSRRIDLDGATGMVAHVPGVGTIGAAPRGFALATGLLNILD